MNIKDIPWFDFLTADADGQRSFPCFSSYAGYAN